MQNPVEEVQSDEELQKQVKILLLKVKISQSRYKDFGRIILFSILNLQGIRANEIRSSAAIPIPTYIPSA